MSIAAAIHLNIIATHNNGLIQFDDNIVVDESRTEGRVKPNHCFREIIEKYRIIKVICTIYERVCDQEVTIY